MLLLLSKHLKEVVGHRKYGSKPFVYKKKYNKAKAISAKLLDLNLKN